MSDHITVTDAEQADMIWLAMDLLEEHGDISHEAAEAMQAGGPRAAEALSAKVGDKTTHELIIDFVEKNWNRLAKEAGAGERLRLCFFGDCMRRGKLVHLKLSDLPFKLNEVPPNIERAQFRACAAHAKLFMNLEPEER